MDSFERHRGLDAVNLLPQKLAAPCEAIEAQNSPSKAAPPPSAYYAGRGGDVHSESGR